MSARHRAARWPNLFLAGPPRSGTTALWRAFGSHPDVFMSPVKESSFFAPATRSGPRLAGAPTHARETAARPELRARLEEVCAPDRATLETLLGRSLPW